MSILLLIGSALAFTLGGVCMKYAEGMTKLLPTALLFAFFLIGAGLQAVAMRRAEMGVAYIFVLGLESVLAFLFGVLIFHESASAARIAAVLMITCGIVLLHK